MHSLREVLFVFGIVGDIIVEGWAECVDEFWLEWDILNASWGMVVM